MELIDESSSGTIPRREFKEALANVAKQINREDLDVDSIVKDVFGRNQKLSRQSIRLALDVNPEVASV